MYLFLQFEMSVDNIDLEFSVSKITKNHKKIQKLKIQK